MKITRTQQFQALSWLFFDIASRDPGFTILAEEIVGGSPHIRICHSLRPDLSILLDWSRGSWEISIEAPSLFREPKQLIDLYSTFSEAMSRAEGDCRYWLFSALEAAPGGRE